MLEQQTDMIPRTGRYRGPTGAHSARLAGSSMDFSETIAHWHKRRYLANRRPLAEAPYLASLYRDLLQRLKTDPRCRFQPFTDTTIPDGRTARIRVRHDVDTPGCIANMVAMVTLDASLGVPAAIYVRVDGDDYDPGAAKEAVGRCRALGADVGLHASCYLADDAWGRFRQEIAVFTNHFGFAPASFTMHGLGAYRAAERQAFCAAVVHRLADFGMRFTDCRPEVRSYDHVFEDCHLVDGYASAAPGMTAAGAGRRCLHPDFAAIPRFLRRGLDYLVLTHPCYWRFDGAPEA